MDVSSVFPQSTFEVGPVVGDFGKDAVFLPIVYLDRTRIWP